MLRREDLNRGIKPFVNRLMKTPVPGNKSGAGSAPAADGAAADPETLVVAHPLNTSGIDYLTFMFDISGIPQKFFPYLGVFKTLLGAGARQKFLMIPRRGLSTLHVRNLPLLVFLLNYGIRPV